MRFAVTTGTGSATGDGLATGAIVAEGAGSSLCPASRASMRCCCSRTSCFNWSSSERISESGDEVAVAAAGLLAGETFDAVWVCAQAPVVKTAMVKAVRNNSFGAFMEVTDLSFLVFAAAHCGGDRWKSFVDLIPTKGLRSLDWH